MARVVAATKDEARDWARALLAAAGADRKDEVKTEFERGAFIAFVVPDDVYEAALSALKDEAAVPEVPSAEALAESGEGPKKEAEPAGPVDAAGPATPPEAAEDLKAAAQKAAKAAAATKAAAKAAAADAKDRGDETGGEA